MNFFRHPGIERLGSLLLIAALLLTLAPAVAFAQEEDAGPPVLILPINNANFLPGATFDIRIEVHADALPEDFAATVNGQDISEFFGVEAEQSGWQFSEEAASEEDLAEVDPATIVTANVATWRGVTLTEPGDYAIVVTADGPDTTVDWTVREPVTSAGAQNVWAASRKILRPSSAWPRLSGLTRPARCCLISWRARLTPGPSQPL